MSLRRALILILTLALVGVPAMAQEYTNPMTVPDQYPPISGATDDYGIGDPFVMRFNGMYYMYASSCEERVRVFTSRDLINWCFEGWCTEGRDVYFAYAPEVVYWRGDFYMITSPAGGGHYILKSESPLGPFRLITHNFGYQIDGSFFVQDDGRVEILFPEGNVIRQCFLNERTMLPDGIKFSTGATLRGWTEGPGLFRRGEWFYLTFTGNHVLSTGYQVAWASRYGDSAGPFSQSEDSTLLIHSVFGDDYKGLGHSSNFIGPDLDSMYTAYHSCVSLAGPARLYNLDRLLTNGGRLYTTGPTNFPMPAPEMPDVWGDAQGDFNDFAESDTGLFAQIEPSFVFTQECVFALRDSTARWLVGKRDEQDVCLITDGSTLSLTAGDELLARADVPPLGEMGRWHTLRVECGMETLYAYVDGMRLIALEDPRVEASRVGALYEAGTSYSFMGCTAQALGSGDGTAVKAIPGRFSAIHALNESELEYSVEGGLSEKVPLLGRADYAVMTGQDGAYAFDLTVKSQDAGKAYTILLDGDAIISGAVPEGPEGSDMFTFATDASEIASGRHVLSILGDGVSLSSVKAYAVTETREMENDFTTKAMRQQFITLGSFNMSDGKLSIKGNHRGFALFGDEGNRDYEITVRFEIPQQGTGRSGVILRATNVSSYKDQVAESWFGYGVTLTKLGFNVQKVRYASLSEAQFCPVPAWESAREGVLTLRMEGGTLTIGLPGGESLYTLTDSDPFTHGLYGFFSTGKELNVLSITARPIS